MRTLLISAVLGLLAGWLIARFALREDGKRVAVDARTAAASDGISRASAGDLPPAPQARGPLALDEQRAEFRAEHGANPYRGDVFSIGLVRSLAPSDLIKAVRAGQIRDDLELAEAFYRIAQADIVAALDLLAYIPGRDLQSRGKNAIVRAAVESNPDSLLDYLMSLPPSEFRAGIVLQLASEWGERDPAAVADHFDRIRSLAKPYQDMAAKRLVESWAKSDFAAAERWASERGEADLLESLTAAQAQSLPPEEAADFLLARPASRFRTEGLVHVFREWAMSDPQAAARRVGELDASPAASEAAEAAGRSAAMNLFLQRADTDAIFDWQKSISDESLRRRFLLGAANIASSNSIPAAEKIIAAIPESRERVEAAGMLAELWMREDPVALSAWLGSLPPSPSRDEAVARFARLLAPTDPERAAQWTTAIEDPDKRERTATQVAEAQKEE